MATNNSISIECVCVAQIHSCGADLFWASWETHHQKMKIRHKYVVANAYGLPGQCPPWTWLTHDLWLALVFTRELLSCRLQPSSSLYGHNEFAGTSKCVEDQVFF